MQARVGRVAAFTHRKSDESFDCGPLGWIEEGGEIAPQQECRTPLKLELYWNIVRVPPIVVDIDVLLENVRQIGEIPFSLRWTVRVRDHL